MPPSRLTADGVYRAGQRRHTVLVAGRMLGVFALTTLLLLGASTLRHVAGDRRAGTGLPPGSTGNDWPGPVLWAGGADRAHLFAIMANCAACALRLIGSDNGGASWTERSLPPDVGRWMPAQAAAVLGASPPIVTGPGVIGLAATKMVDLRPTPTVSLGPAGAATRWWVSVDSARSWRPVTTQSTAASAVPANGWADCVPDPGRDRCTGYLVDPLTATESPLENQPTRDPQTMSMLAGGALWATSDDGPSRPAVSVSHDAGRTWATHEFT